MYILTWTAVVSILYSRSFAVAETFWMLTALAYTTRSASFRRCPIGCLLQSAVTEQPSVNDVIHRQSSAVTAARFIDDIMLSNVREMYVSIYLLAYLSWFPNHMKASCFTSCNSVLLVYWEKHSLALSCVPTIGWVHYLRAVAPMYNVFPL